MGLHSRTWVSGAAWGVAVLLASGVPAAWAQKAPPAPPTKVVKFPKQTSRPPVPKIIRLAPGQKVITAEQMRKAPTVYAANRRGAYRVSKPLSRPAPLQVPGAPRILTNIPIPESTSPAPKVLPKKPLKKK